MTPYSACLVVASLLSFVSCAKRTVSVKTPAPPDLAENFIDLAPGWRVRVITPITRSGATRVAVKAESAEGNTITLRTDNDFLGYETAYYNVSPRGRGVGIRFASAERMVDGKSSVSDRPLVPLFTMPGRIRHVRLLYLIRQSSSDHDMAVLGANSLPHLEELTNAVRADPAACVETRDRYCSWPPAGIAIRAEVQSFSGEWQPAR